MTLKTRLTSMMESFNGPHDLARPAPETPLSERAAAGEFRSAGTVPMYGYEAQYFTDGKQFFWLYDNRRNYTVSRAEGEGPEFSVRSGNALERKNIQKAAKGAKLYKSLRDVEAAAADTLKAMAMGENETATDELSEAGIQKSSWPEFIKHATVGLAYLGSKFDFSVEEMVDAIKRNGVDTKKLFTDRKLAGGTSRLRMTKLDKNGKESGVSELAKVGKVFRFGDFFIVYNEKDSNSVVAYGIPAGVAEALTAETTTVTESDDEVPGIAELADWLEGLAADIPEALDELKRGRVGRTTAQVVGTVVRSRDEEWYQDLFR